MAKKDRNILKSYFETGDIPTEGQYANLIDSFAILDSENTGSLDLKGNITATQFIGDGRYLKNVTSSLIDITGVTASISTGSLLISGNLYYSSGSTNVLLGIRTTGSIIPGGNNIWDLGSPTQYFRSTHTSNIYAVNIKATDVNITNDITASGNISGSNNIAANSFTGTFNGALSSSAQIATNISGAFTATSASFSTSVTTNVNNINTKASITQLNASSSALQTNIDTKASITQLNVSSSTLQTNLNTSSSALQTNIDAKSSIAQLNTSSSALQTNIDAKASIVQLNTSSSALQTNLNTSSSALQTNIDAKASIAQLNVSSSTLQTNIDAKASIAQLNASSSALQTNIDAKASITQLNTSSSALQTNLNTSSSALQTNIDSKASIAQLNTSSSALILSTSESINSATSSLSASLATSIASNAADTFKSTGQRNGNSFITGSLHLTGSTSDLRVDGTVGIGVAAPSAVESSPPLQTVLHIKSNNSGNDPTVLIEGVGATDNAALRLKNADEQWTLSNAGSSYSDAFLIRSESAVNGNSYPFMISKTATGPDQYHPLVHLNSTKLSVLAKFNDPTAANLLVSGNMTLLGPNGHITASGNISSSGTIIGSTLDIIGTSNLDIVDIDGAVDMASTLTVGSHISASGNISGSSLNVTNNITGSNISASGKVIALSGSFDRIDVDTLQVLGANTLVNWGNFRNRMPVDDRAFEVSTNPYVAGGFRFGQPTPTPAVTGSAPHLHFMLSGSGQAGVGLLNPEHTLHVSSSNSSWKALYVDGDTQLTGNITSSGNILINGGALDIKNTGAQSYARFYCESNNAHYAEIKAQPHALFSGNVTTLLPAYNFNFAAPHFQANVTASGNISASGNILTAGNVSASGTITGAGISVGASRITFVANSNNTIGALNPNELNFAGTDPVIFAPHVKLDSHLTASGNISASGYISASAFVGDGSGLTGISSATSAITSTTNGANNRIATYTGTAGLNGEENLTFDGTSLTLEGNITASGNISASGNIVANKLISSISGAFQHITASVLDVDSNTIRIGGSSFAKTDLDALRAGKSIPQTARAGFTNRMQPDAIFGKHDGDYVRFNVGNRVGTFLNTSLVHDLNFTGSNNYFAVGLNNNTQLRLTGQVTASSHISASGTITANKGVFGTDNTEQSRVIITSTGNITASANISASGTITANEGVFGTLTNVNTTHVTASGNISSSGTLSSSGIFVAGNISAISMSGDGSGLTGIIAATPAGTYSSSLQTLGNITSSGNISASGNNHTFGGGVNLTQIKAIGDSDTEITLGSGTGRIDFTSDGSTQLRLDPNKVIFSNINEFEVNAPITGSNISASGIITALSMSGDGSGLTGVTSTVPAGTYSSSLQTLGNITSSGNISASGTIIGSALQVNTTDTSENATHYVTFQKTGNSLTNITNGFSFNPSTDELTLGGVINIAGQAGTITGLTSLTSTNITSSGNISASGTIIASNLSGTNTGDQDLGTYMLSANTASFAVTSSNVLFGNITASGNISASGDVLGDTIIANNIVFYSGSTSVKVETPDVSGNGNGGDLTLEAGNAFGPNFNGGDLTFNAGRGSGVGIGGNITLNTFGKIAGGTAASSGSFTLNSQNFSVSTTGNVNIASHITASGNISSSGTITANRLSLIGPISITSTGNSLLGNDISDTHKITGNITASNNISASGTIIASKLSLPDIVIGDSLDASFDIVHGSRGEIRSQLQSSVAADTGWTLELRNTSIAANSLIVANVIGGEGAIITGSVLTANVVAANTASFNFFNIGNSIDNNSAFTASFAIF